MINIASGRKRTEIDDQRHRELLYVNMIACTIYVHAKYTATIEYESPVIVPVIASLHAMFRGFFATLMTQAFLHDHPCSVPSLMHASVLMIAVDVFAACAVQLFHLMPYATVRSILSKQVGEDEQGEQSGRRGRTR